MTGPSQRAREFAAAYMFAPFTNPHRAMIGGLRDDNSLVQAFARFEAETRAPLEAENAEKDARIAALEGENGKLREATQWAIETLQEINPSNYDHDDVCTLNAASVEVVLGLDAELRALTATEGEGA